MKKILFISLAAAALLCSCQDNRRLNLPSSNTMDIGLNSTMTFTRDVNIFHSRDYILDPSKIDSVTCSTKGVEITLSDDKEIVTVNGAKLQKLNNLTLWCEGIPYSVPVRLSDEVEFTFRYNPAGKRYKRVQIAGQMNDWVPDVHPDLTLDADSNYTVTLMISPGTYLYQLVRDGEWNHDETNPEMVDNNSGKFNSILHVKGTQELAPILVTDEIKPGKVVLKSFNAVGTVFAYWQNYQLPANFTKAKDDVITITIPEEAKEVKRSYIRVISSNMFGISNDILVPLENGEILDNPDQITRFDKHAEILYSLMVDRFVDGKKENNHPMNRPDVNPKCDYQGGDIVGITQKIKDGYFDKMGFSTIWISPIVQNPLTPYGGQDKPVRTKFAGYHGYWPISSSQIDFRFGTEEEMKEMVQTAHEHGINVIMDYVANHVHKEHPMFKADQTICTPLYLPDGTKNIGLWNEQRLTTWFDDFLPTLDYSRTEIVEAMTDSAIGWVNTYDLDGFRHDACKHVQESFWRTLTYKLKTQVEIPGNKTVYQIGESYGSPKLISSYVNSGMLDGQFDFNVSDDASSVFALNSEDFHRISNTLNMSLKVYGSHNLMGYITGNHDRARFISYASGALSYSEDSKLIGWTRPIEVKDTVGYDKIIQLNAFNMTIPGVPVVYYGDEFGDAGANDPDCRRMMRFDDQLNRHEQRVLEAVSKLGRLRTSNLALIYGDFVEFKLENKIWAYGRNYFGETAIVVFNRNTEACSIDITLPDMFAGKEYETLFGQSVSFNGNVMTIELPANGVEVLTMKKQQ